MSTYNHTAISNGDSNDASTVETPLAALDAAIGDLTGLSTTPKTSVAGALGGVALGTTATTISGAIAENQGEIGDVSALTTTATDLAAAINEHETDIGDVSTLTTTATDLSAAIIEVDDTARTNVIFDPFNKYTTPLVNWGNRSRWRDDTAALSLDAADASNPYGGTTLVFGAGTTIAGKYIWLDEIGVQPGDAMYFSILINAAAADQYKLGFRAYDSGGSALGTASLSSGTTSDGTDQTITLSVASVDATAAYFLIYIQRVAGGSDNPCSIYAWWGGAGTDIAAYPTQSIANTNFWQEIIDARTSYDTLTERIAGDLVGDTERAYTLRDYRGQIAKVQLAVATEQAIVALIGDSWFMRDDISPPIRTILQTKYGDAGAGYAGIGGPDGTNSLIHGKYDTGITFSRAGTWTDDDQTATSLGVDVTHANTTDTATPATVTYTTEAATFVIHYYEQAGGGTFTYALDGGAATPVNTGAGTAGYSTVSVATGDELEHTLVLTVTVAGAAGVTLMGIDAQLTGNGVRVHKLGNGSTQASHWVAVDSTNWATGLQALAPNVCLILLGTNEMNQNTSPTTYGTNLTTLIGRIQAAMPLCDIALIGPTDNGLAGKTYTMAEYATELRSVASTLGVAVLDGYLAMGSYDDNNSRSLFDDTLHMNNNGGRAFASLICRRLLMEAD